MAVPPVGSTPPPVPPRKPNVKLPSQAPATAQAATAATQAPNAPKTPAAPPAKNAPAAPAPQPAPTAPGTTAPAPPAPTAAAAPAPNPVERALGQARETRLQVEAELAANKFDVMPARREQEQPEQPGITYARATQLVARLQAFQIYQANAAGQAGDVNPAEDELNQILQGVQTKTQG